MTNLDSIFKSRDIILPTKIHLVKAMAFPWWLRWQSVCPQCQKPRFDPWVGKIPWRRKWQPTPVFLPGKSHGQRSLEGCSPWGRKGLDTTERLTHTEIMQPWKWVLRCKAMSTVDGNGVKKLKKERLGECKHCVFSRC